MKRKAWRREDLDQTMVWPSGHGASDKEHVYELSPPWVQPGTGAKVRYVIWIAVDLMPAYDPSVELTWLNPGTYSSPKDALAKMGYTLVPYAPSPWAAVSEEFAEMLA